MKKQVIVSSFIALLFLFGSTVQVNAALQALPGEPMPTNQRDKFQTDLFSGSSTYSYPIKVPNGTDNLTPSVSLSYNNQGAHDLSMFSGMGWQVDRDYVQRDVNYTPSDTSDDKYKLHFKGATYDLVYNSSDSLFHTKIESHLKVQQFLSGGQGSTGMYWQVTTTDGTIYRFGYASGSEFGCNGQSYDGYWNLDQVTDIHSNHIYYSYTSSSGAAYLSQITYNTDQTREVDFSYATNPYQIPAYVQGCNVTETSRLSTIQVKANSNLVHEYDLSFNQATNNQNLLSSITEKGTDGSSLPATTFSYNGEVTSWNTNASTWLNAGIGADLTASNVNLIDVNGDGLPDIVKTSNSGSNDSWYVYLNTGSSWNPTPQTWVNNASINAYLGQTNTKLMDVNGDGLPDIVQSNRPGNDEWKVLLNTGSSWSTTWSTWLNADLGVQLSYNNIKLIDVNGDGLPDIVKSSNCGGPCDTWQVSLNTGSGWSSTLQTWINAASVGAEISRTDVTLADVNGDGLTDIVQSTNCGNACDTWKVLLNTGSSWSTTWQTWINQGNIGAELPRTDVTLADVNGDGLPDIVQSHDNGNSYVTWQVLMNLGSSWSTTWQTWVNNAHIGSQVSDNDIRLADVNGDGLLDIVKSDVNSGIDYWVLFSNNGYAPDILSTLQTPQGGTVHFDYNPSTQYSNGYNLPFPLWVVKQMTVNNGMTNTQQTNDVTAYSYANGLYNYQNHEFRGFSTVNETDPNTAKKVYTFNQDDATKGKLAEVDTNDSSNNPYAKTVNTWSNSLSNGIYTVNLTQEKNYTYDGTASNPKIAENDYTYDTYGNITKKSAVGDTSTNSDDRFIYNTYTASTSAWIVNTVSDTYVNKSDDSTKVNETWNYYDGHTNLTDAPTKGDLTKQIKWLSGGTNPTTTYTYDSYGNKTQETDANSHSTSWSYGTTDTTHTYPDSTTNAKSQTTTMTYDLGTGNQLSKTDPNSFTTSYTYDPFGRISKEIDPYDSSTYPTLKYQYFDSASPSGMLVSQLKTSSASATLDAYIFVDGFERTLQTRTPAEDTSKQIVAETYYDPNGKVLKQSVPHLDTLSTSYATPVSGIETTSMAYDPVARVTTITNPQGTTKTTSYDHWTQTGTDENSHQIKKYFDAFNNISQVDEYVSGLTFSTTFNYDSLNNLTKTTDALGNITNYTFDTLSRQTTLADPDMGTWNYQYDGVDNQTQLTDARSKSATKTYDQLNRLATVSYPSDPTVTYIYDTNTKGTLAQVADGAGTVSYTYDNRLRKTQEQRVTDGITWTTQFTYDAANRLLTRTNPDSEVLTYAFDAQGEVASLSGIVNNIDYNAQGKVTSKALANSLTTNYSYNTNDFRLNRIQTGTAQDVSYAYDNVGNVASTTDNIASKSASFAYDSLNRLTTASQSGSYNFTYAYDKVGNMTSFTGFGGTTNYTYGSSTLVHAVATATTNTMVDDDALALGWADASFNTTNATTTQVVNVYSGSVAMASAVGANGGVDFQAPTSMNTSGSDTLHFALKASQAGQQYDVYVDSVYGTPLTTPVSLANYGGQPNSKGWTVYNIPLADLGATNVPLGDIVIHNPKSLDEPVVYVDQVELSNGVPTPLTTSISDDWSSGSINTAKWDNWSSSHASVVSNQLQISSSLSSGYYGVDSAVGSASEDLTGSYVSNQLVSAGNQSLTSWEVYPILITKNGATNNQLLFYVSGNTLHASKVVSGTLTDLHTATYSSSTHKYFKIRESGGTTYFDTSSDGITYTNFASTADPFDITHVNVGPMVGTWQTESSTTTATFDNFNITPITSPTSSIADDWSSGSINSSQWDDWSSSHASVVSKQLQISSTLGGAYYGVDSAVGSASEDLTGSYVSNQLVNAGNQSIASWEVYPVLITKASASNYQLLFYVSNNTVHASKVVNGTSTDLHTATYSSTNHKFFRIREIGGNIYYDTSPDGLTWSSFASTANPFDITQVNVGQMIGTWQAESSTTTATFDNFNIASALPTTSLTDDWSSGGISAAKWNNWAGSQASVVSSQLQIASVLAGGYFGVDSGLSGVSLNLTGFSVSDKLISAGNQSLASLEVMPVLITMSSASNYQLYFDISNNTLYAYKQISGTSTSLHSASYNSTTHKYFKIRESSGTIYFDTSSDGTTWTNFTSVANPFDITHVVIGHMLGTWNAESSTTSATFDNFNIAP